MEKVGEPPSTVGRESGSVPKIEIVKAKPLEALQEPKTAEVSVTAPLQPEAPVVPVTQPQGDMPEAKAFIYNHESGNVPCKINGGAIDCAYDGDRACGLGQALPCQKLTAVCALSDYACQDNWFTNSYMVPRYGTWENAKAFWLAHGWW